jgi:hypothetical protein
MICLSIFIITRGIEEEMNSYKREGRERLVVLLVREGVMKEGRERLVVLLVREGVMKITKITAI